MPCANDHSPEFCPLYALGWYYSHSRSAEEWQKVLLEFENEWGHALRKKAEAETVNGWAKPMRW